jgi:hypothetical protein
MARLIARRRGTEPGHRRLVHDAGDVPFVEIRPAVEMESRRSDRGSQVRT